MPTTLCLVSNQNQTILEKLKGFDISDVIEEFKFLHPELSYSTDDVVTSFFLFLIEANTVNPQLEPSASVDLFWHLFLSHTMLYIEFCNSCFGKFIHHTSSYSRYTTKNNRGCNANDDLRAIAK